MTDLTKHRIEDQPANPYDKANVISKVFFYWLNPFIKKGFQQELSLKDLYQVPKENLSKDLGHKLSVEWNKELALHAQGKRASLTRALARAFSFWYLLSGIWITLGECIIRPLQAISLGWLINDVTTYLTLASATEQADVQTLQVSYHRVLYDALCLIAFSIISLITVHPYVFCTQHTGMKVRIACCHLIYRHSLRLSNAAIGQTTVGQMVNLLSNDVNRFDIALNYIQYLVIAPLQAIVVVAVLSVMYLGVYSTLAGSALLLLYVPFQTLMGRWFGRLRLATAERSDERIRLMNEIIPAMRVIKMYTWEDSFERLVEVARANEVRLIRYTSFLRGINMALFFVSSKIILFISFITYVLLGYTLEPEIVFVSITLFNSVRLLMTLFFPYGVSQLAEMLISCNRLQEFLLLPVQEKSNRIERHNGERTRALDADEIKIECTDASANWTVINKTLHWDTGAAAGKPPAAPRAPAPLDTLWRGPKARDRQHSATTQQVLDASQQLLSGSYADMRNAGTLSRTSSKNSLFASNANVHLITSGHKLAAREPATCGQLATNETAITALRNVSYSLKGGELLIIVGRVGSGKSSVLMSILGELPLMAGQMSISGKISYANQEPWIFAGTVRQNVLFGKKFDPERYMEVLRVCALDKDVRLFGQGDETVVGERGVSLSGGQRARINLARAIYYDADIYLLDDPLSAVDTLVAKHIFNECICGFLKTKAVILATHQTQFVRKDSKVLFLQDGHQVSCKSHADNKDLQTFMGSTWERSDSDSAAVSGSKLPLKRKPQLQPQQQQQQQQQQLQTPPSKLATDSTTAADAAAAAAAAKKPDSSSSSLSSTGDDDDHAAADDAQAKQKLLETHQHHHDAKHQNESITTKAGLAIYVHYVKSCAAPILLAIIVVSNIGTQLLFNGSDFWLSYWTDTEQRKAANGATSNYEPVTLTDTLSLYDNALVYTILIGSLFGLTLVRTTCFFVACMRSSINLHNRLFRSVLRAPIKFFDYNPIGVLLNRVSRDMGIIDDLLPPTAFDTIEIFINVLGILATAAIVYPLNAVPAVCLCGVIGLIRLLYMRTVRAIKSIEGVTRSPVFSHLAGSLNGLATIRAFGVEHEFERKFDDYQDIHSSAWFLFMAASRWLGCSLDWISLAYITVITLVMTLTIGSATGSQIGLVISSALALSGSFQWGVRQSTELESQMTSVARVKEYSELPEEPARTTSEPPPASWPSKGQIEFERVSLRYFDNEPPVLHELTFKINAAEKVGIVGRTGAGKSSIMAVLFRLTEPEGSVYIDGVDTKSIGLHELRKKLSIIPQEPILFNGPIRRNLDPFGEYTDGALWRALEQCELAHTVRNLPGALDAELREGGSNFSVGERQLICLARAVLRQNTIIILDEATANVDPGTDKFIQRTISDSFTNCTRLTIAHRLHTIMDSDRVLVMDAGRVTEFDAPHLLLQNETGVFATMVANTGKSAAHLKKLARVYYERRQAKASQPATAGSH